MPSEFVPSRDVAGAEATPSLNAPPYSAVLQSEYHAEGVLGVASRIIDIAGIAFANFLVYELEGRLATYRGIDVVGVTNITSILLLIAFSKVAAANVKNRAPNDYGRNDYRRFEKQSAALIVSAVLQGVMLQQFGAAVWASAAYAGSWFAVTAAVLVTARSFGDYVFNLTPVRRLFLRRFVVVGSDRQALRLAGRLRQNGTLVETIELPNQGLDQAGLSVLEGLVTLSQSERLHGIIIAVSPAPGDQSLAMYCGWKLRAAMSDVFVMPHLMNASDMVLPMQSVSGVSMAVLQRRPLDEWQRFRKRALDLSFSIAAALFLLPVFVMVAVAIKLETRGPVFFLQHRRGINSRPFLVIKFRTMFVEATDQHATLQTSRHDPRVTRVGKWLRRLSIDELPQLLNVIRGEMSLVGPRPHAPNTSVDGQLLNDAIEEYSLRYRVKPGITGLAQVNGSRGQLVTTDDLRRRLAFDFEYIHRWSIGFDLEIMALTVLREIVSRHAF